MSSLMARPLEDIYDETRKPIVVTFGEQDVMAFPIIRGTTCAMAIQPLDGLLSQRNPHGDGIKVELRFVSEEALEGVIFALEDMRKKCWPKTILIP